MVTLEKPLSDVQYAALAEGVSITHRAEKHVSRVFDHLKHCGISIDEDSLKNAQFYLDKLFANQTAVISAHLDAMQKAKA